MIVALYDLAWSGHGTLMPDGIDKRPSWSVVSVSLFLNRHDTQKPCGFMILGDCKVQTQRVDIEHVRRGSVRKVLCIDGQKE